MASVLFANAGMPVIDFGGEHFVKKFEATQEAIIDFLIPVPDSELMEFNVFKYTPAGNALVALQFARRVKLGEIDAEELSEIRQRALKEMAGYEMGPVRRISGSRADVFGERDPWDSMNCRGRPSKA